VKLILFDVDGTLVDSQTIIVAAQRAAFERMGLKAPSRERSLSIVGLSLVEAFTALAGPRAPIGELVAAYKEAFSALRSDPAHEELLFPGAAECLDRLAACADVRLGIATGKTRRGVSHLIERFGWETIFSTIQTADDAPSKPHPAMIRQAMAAVGARPQDTAMVGDSGFDVTMARAAEVLPIGVTWGFQPVAALREAGAQVIVNSYPDLDPVLDGFLRETGTAVPAGLASGPPPSYVPVDE
jgi:phosphoglycolate phosphatase